MDGEVEKSDSVTKYFEQSFQSLIELLNIRMYEEEKWKRSCLKYEENVAKQN